MRKIIIILFVIHTAVFAQKNYFVSKDASGDFTTIKQVNSALLNFGDIVNFKSGEKFSDETLICKEGVTYTTYGGSAKAIIGDASSNANSVTIQIDQEDVVINNLRIFGYKNSRVAIRYSKGGLIITECQIIGSETSHIDEAFGIELYSSDVFKKKTLISRNEIKDFYKGLYLRQPYNLEISYNKIYRIYKYTSKYGVGGDCIVGTFVTSHFKSFSSNYTFHIHHNELTEFEHTALWIGNISEVLIEYNDIHHNLDERLYWGGMKNGSVGKLWDNTVAKETGSLGHIIRYNYIHNLKRHAEIGYSYNRPTISQVEAKELQQYYTGSEYPVFVNGNGDGTDYIQTSGGTFSGQGYGNFWIHNNLMYNNGGALVTRNTVATGQYSYRDEYAGYFINNTLVIGGFNNHVTDVYGIILDEYGSQSPLIIVNNILDFQNPNARMTGRYKEEKLFLDYNIYTLQSGTTKVLPSVGDQKAAYYQLGADQNLASGSGEKYQTDPNWVDSTSMIFAPNIGPNGVWIPDVRIKVGGNAYNNGLAYNLIGDTYSVLGHTHQLGKDPTGRSFAFDIFGNLRSTNDIGAVGSVNGEVIDNPQSSSMVPLIIVQPDNIPAITGDDITLTLTATCDEPIGYQWWKSPFVSVVESKITNNEKYSGATSNTLTIKNVTAEDASIQYLCEVYNSNDHSNLWVNSSPGSITITQSQGPTESGNLKVFLEAAYNNEQMKSTLNSAKLFPKDQPYKSEPWNLASNNEITNIKSNYVDWIIVELRKELSEATYRKSAVLTSEGKVVNPNGTKFSFENIENDKYYISIIHRNHLNIISSEKIEIQKNEPIIYNFTDSPSKAYGVNSLTEIGNGIYGMYAGDADANGLINNMDFGDVANNILQKGYLNNDLDMNGIVNVLDYNKINKNILKSSKIPK